MTALYFVLYALTAALLFALCFTVGFMAYSPAPVTTDGLTLVRREWMG